MATPLKQHYRGCLLLCASLLAAGLSHGQEGEPQMAKLIVRDICLSKVHSSGTEQLAELKRLGARITFDDQKRIIGVNLSERRITDADLVQLRGLPHLQELDLTRTRITGAGLENVKDSTALRTLFLTDTKVDDAGIAHLKGMRTLALIGLSGTKITDASLDHLRELTGLRRVFCLGTGVTETGVDKLRRALPECQITY
jgi:hypothetical protein